MRTRWASFIISILLAVGLPALAAPLQGSGGQKHKVEHPPAEIDKALPAQFATPETIGKAAEGKSLADGLYMSGQFTYNLTGSNAYVTLDRINNDSSSRTTGTLQLSLWATDYEPVRGAGISGYRLVNFSTLSPLQATTYYQGIVRSASYLPPPNGAYWLVLVLSEYNPSGCPSNADGFCLEDTFVSFSQVRWGSLRPTFNYTDMWWTASESGWGISLVQHESDFIFGAWFTYDEFGIPMWYVASGCELVGDFCYGTLYETRGSPFSATFNPNAVTVTPVGTMQLTFSSYGTASMRYNVRGVIRTKSITRQPF